MQQQRNMKINNFHLTSLQMVAGVYLGSERKQRALSNKLVGDHLEVELAPFSFNSAMVGKSSVEQLLPIHPASLGKLFNF